MGSNDFPRVVSSGAARAIAAGASSGSVCHAALSQLAVRGQPTRLGPHG